MKIGSPNWRCQYTDRYIGLNSVKAFLRSECCECISLTHSIQRVCWCIVNFNCYGSLIANIIISFLFVSFFPQLTPHFQCLQSLTCRKNYRPTTRTCNALAHTNEYSNQGKWERYATSKMLKYCQTAFQSLKLNRFAILDKWLWKINIFFHSPFTILTVPIINFATLHASKSILPQFSIQQLVKLIRKWKAIMKYCCQ